MRADTSIFIVALLCLLPTVSTEAVLFYPKEAYGVGDAPRAVATDDLNGDGILDLAVGNGSGDTASVLLGNGDGTFQIAEHYAVDNEPYAIAIGELNGDNNPDLVTANLFGNNVSVLLGNGDGTFQAAAHYPTNGLYPTAVAISDLDGDGSSDLIVAGGIVAVFFGNGDGTFQAVVKYLVANSCSHVAISDLNGDSFPDLVLANQSSDNYISILLGNGDGTFAPRVDYDVYSDSNSFMSVAIADLDGDGALDIAAAHVGESDGVSVFLGNGDGTFSAIDFYPTCQTPLSIITGDLDDDNNTDLALVCNGGTGIVFPGNGDGTFREQVLYEADFNSTWVAIGDLSGDGLPDLAVTSYSVDTVTVVINTGMGFESTVGSDMTCTPQSGTLPFTTHMAFELANQHDWQTRRMAGRINIQLGSGEYIPNWRAGYTNISAGESFNSSWNLNIPAIGSLVGDNTFTLVAEDVTAAPYNQPPYPPAGDTATAACTVTGIAP